jgi:hypothetical protein
LAQRTVNIPNVILSAETQPPSEKKAPSKPKNPLIQELTDEEKASKPKSILKHPATNVSNRATPVLSWSWTKEDEHIKIIINIPKLVSIGFSLLSQETLISLILQTRALIEQSNLDIEPKRFILEVPDHQVLDVNLSVSDAEIVAKASSKSSGMIDVQHTDDSNSEPNNALTLKRQRDLDVDRANAQWKVEDGVLVILA